MKGRKALLEGLGTKLFVTYAIRLGRVLPIFLFPKLTVAIYVARTNCHENEPV